MAVTAQQVTELYLAYFGRPPDVNGLSFYTSNPAHTVASVSAAFSASPESQALYGSAFGAAQINAIYQVLFGRPAEAAGINHWLNQVNSGALTPAGAALGIMNGAQNLDKVAVTNKLNISTQFLAQLDTAAEIVGYSGDASAASARAFLQTVTDTAASVTTAQNGLAAAVANAVAQGSGNVGTTYSLGTAPDNIPGTGANDTFNALIDATTPANSTLSATDVIRGGAGTDTMNITTVGATTTLNGADISGVEVVNFRVTGASASLDASTLPGLTNVNADRGTGTLTVTNMAAGATYGIVGNGTAVLGNQSAGYVAAATAATVNISGGVGPAGTTAPTLALVGTGLTSATFNSTGASNTIGAVTLTAGTTDLTINATNALTTGAVGGAGLKTITVTGAGNVSLSATAVPTNVTSINASAATGNVTATSGAITTAFTGGSGNDKLTIGTLVYNGTAKIDGGAGTADILAIADDTATLFTTAAKANISNFEVLEVSGATKTFNFEALTGLTALNVAAATSAVVNNLGAATPVTITGAQTTNLTLNVKDATNPLNTGDSLTVTLDLAGAATTTSVVTVADLTSNGLETLNIVSSGVLGNDATVTTDDNAVTLAGLATSNVNSVKVTGASDLSLTTGAIARTVNIDGSGATGNLTVTAAANTSATAISGGAGKDTLTGGAGTDVLNGGANDDTLTAGAGADTITGGTGKNTFMFDNASTGTPTATNFDTITDFRAGTGNVIDFGATALVITAGASAAAAGTAAIAATGIATFNGADTTLLQQMTAVAAGIQATGAGSVAGETAVWQVGADAYLFISDATGGLSATDVVVKLTGVTVGATDRKSVV